MKKGLLVVLALFAIVAMSFNLKTKSTSFEVQEFVNYDNQMTYVMSLDSPDVDEPYEDEPVEDESESESGDEDE